jgi:hypothetical protein
LVAFSGGAEVIFTKKNISKANHFETKKRQVAKNVFWLLLTTSTLRHGFWNAFQNFLGIIFRSPLVIFPKTNF